MNHSRTALLGGAKTTNETKASAAANKHQTELLASGATAASGLRLRARNVTPLYRKRRKESEGERGAAPRVEAAPRAEAAKEKKKQRN
jgi:hypothetical protein